MKSFFANIAKAMVNKNGKIRGLNGYFATYRKSRDGFKRRSEIPNMCTTNIYESFPSLVAVDGLLAFGQKLIANYWSGARFNANVPFTYLN